MQDERLITDRFGHMLIKYWKNIFPKKELREKENFVEIWMNDEFLKVFLCNSTFTKAFFCIIPIKLGSTSIKVITNKLYRTTIWVQFPTAPSRCDITAKQLRGTAAMLRNVKTAVNSLIITVSVFLCSRHTAKFL